MRFPSMKGPAKYKALCETCECTNINLINNNGKLYATMSIGGH